MVLSEKNRRRFYRHPIEIPVQVTELKTVSSRTVDVSEGGISFVCDHYLEKGTSVEVAVPAHDHLFRMHAHVAYSRKDTLTGLFRTGVSFDDLDSLYRAKLAEEILCIEKYREELSQKNGRDITEEEAAREWIKKNAKKFGEIFDL